MSNCFLVFWPHMPIQIQMTAPLKLSYAEKLHKLESQYSKLLVSLSYIFDAQLFTVHIICEKGWVLNSDFFFILIKNTSRNQERHLDTLHDFVSRATRELIWLNEKEEEEVAYDWSERNSNITRKKEYHAVCIASIIQREKLSHL